MEEIKHCPFCGGEADLWYKWGKHGYLTFVECEICSAQSKPFSLGREIDENWYESASSKKAIAFWNRRVKETQNDN